MMQLYKHFIIKDDEYSEDGYIEICSNEDEPDWPMIRYMECTGDDEFTERQTIYLDPRQVPFIIEALKEFLEKKNGCL